MSIQYTIRLRKEFSWHTLTLHTLREKTKRYNDCVNVMFAYDDIAYVQEVGLKLVGS